MVQVRNTSCRIVSCTLGILHSRENVLKLSATLNMSSLLEVCNIASLKQLEALQ